MRSSEDVITSAVGGYTAELATEMEVSLPRMYQLLSDKCPYPKSKRLIRQIAKVNQAGARLIKADMDAMFSDILERQDAELTAVDLHREAFEAVQSILQMKSRAEQKTELRELISISRRFLESLDKENVLKAV